MIGEFDALIKSARQERAVAVGNLIADAFIWLNTVPSKIGSWLQPSPLDLNAASSAEDVRRYAARIAKTDPGFANDLFAAANRSEAT